VEGRGPQVDAEVAHVVTDPSPVVRAGGGLVWRRDDEGPVEVLVIHMRSSGVWGWPKGKVNSEDVDDSHTALREVWEETGFRCSLGRELPMVAYDLPDGRRKQVRYWVMHVIDGAFEPNSEVDEVRWMPIDDAAELLTYPLDRHLLSVFRDLTGS
jgi:8-oxo-dGTP diphosphatase